MLSVKINHEIYKLPMSEVYAEQFKNFVIDDIIILDNLKGKELYDTINLLFGFVVNSLCVLDEEDYPSELLDEKKEIRSKIESIDRLQSYFARLQDYEKSINIIKEFLIKMLVHYDKLMSYDEKIERVF